MGTVRNRNFDAVVGIGSKYPWEDSKEIAGKITWVGVGPYRMRSPTHRGDLIAFEQFVLLDGDGRDFEKLAPNLAKRFYQGGARAIINSYDRIEKEELDKLIASVLNSRHCKSNKIGSCHNKLSARRKKCSKRYPGSCSS